MRSKKTIREIFYTRQKLLLSFFLLLLLSAKTSAQLFVRSQDNITVTESAYIFQKHNSVSQIYIAEGTLVHNFPQNHANKDVKIAENKRKKKTAFITNEKNQKLTQKEKIKKPEQQKTPHLVKVYSSDSQKNLSVSERSFVASIVNQFQYKFSGMVLAINYSFSRFKSYIQNTFEHPKHKTAYTFNNFNKTRPPPIS